MACCTAFSRSTFSAGTVGVRFNQSITGVCEDGASCTGITLNGSLPPGLNFSSSDCSATISGTPTQTGNFSFSLTLISFDCPDVVQTFRITIRPKRKRQVGVLPGQVPSAYPNDLFFNINEFNNYIYEKTINGFNVNDSIIFNPDAPAGVVRGHIISLRSGGTQTVNIKVPQSINYYGAIYNYNGIVGNNYHYVAEGAKGHQQQQFSPLSGGGNRAGGTGNR